MSRERRITVDPASAIFAVCAVAFTVFALFFSNLWFAFQPKGTLSCASFGSCVDAQAALHDKYHPQKQLDANHDGTACDNPCKAHPDALLFQTN